MSGYPAEDMSVLYDWEPHRYGIFRSSPNTVIKKNNSKGNASPDNERIKLDVVKHQSKPSPLSHDR